MDVILCHSNADFDSLGAMIGAKHLNPRALIALPAALNANVRRFVGLYRDAFGMVDFAALDPAGIERVILVDAQDPARAGNVRSLVERADVSWEILDHHPLLDRPLPPGPHEIRSVGAATTLLVTRLQKAGEVLSAPEATGMLLGIMEDTGRLSFPSTTPEDAEAQRAKLSLMGVEAKVTEREQSGRQVFRVRVGPFDKKEDADRSKERLEASGVETALVRVQR